MPQPKLTVLAHEIVAQSVVEGDLAIDATAGNGHDTVFLANLVGESGLVLAFDIQATAIAATRTRLQRANLLSRVRLIHETHANLTRHLERPAAGVMFNLGYLPGGDHSLITRTAETLRALEVARLSLRSGGVLSILCYPGHPGGKEETETVVQWAKPYHASFHHSSSSTASGPLLITLGLNRDP